MIEITDNDLIEDIYFLVNHCFPDDMSEAGKLCRYKLEVIIMKRVESELEGQKDRTLKLGKHGGTVNFPNGLWDFKSITIEEIE